LGFGLAVALVAGIVCRAYGALSEKRYKFQEAANC